ncbi:MAG: phosphatase PAP2 family protein [Deltaproteobacteria bacterium]|nr:phosphatase PAP2 family protein [Deltaproteobacteria bacterium]
MLRSRSRRGPQPRALRVIPLLLTAPLLRAARLVSALHRLGAVRVVHVAGVLCVVVVLFPQRGAAQASLSLTPIQALPPSVPAGATSGPAATVVPAAAPSVFSTPGLPGDHYVVGSGLSLVAGIQMFVTRPDVDAVATPITTNWRGGVLLDEPMRDLMRIGDDEARERAATVSDALLFATVANAFLIDAIAAPIAQGDARRALDAGAAYSLAMGMTLVLGQIVKEGVARARPFERYCLEDPGGFGCENADRFASFYSLHSAVAFTSAGFSCAMSLERQLYGDPMADALNCGASIVAATTVALLRIAADRHYFSDVVIGSLMGLAIGYVVPLFVVASRPPAGAAESPAPDATAVVTPLYTPGANGNLRTSTVGLSVAGTW